MAPTWYAAIWTVGAAVVFLGAVALLWWGLRGDRSKGRWRCPKCWYDMRGSIAAGRLACPECGYEARGERQLRKSRRRWRPIVAGLILLMPYVYAGWVIGGWRREHRIAAQVTPGEYGVVLWARIGPDWFRDRLPRGWRAAFNRVSWVELYYPSEEDVRLVGRLVHIDTLEITWGEGMDTSLAHLEELDDLLILTVYRGVTDAGLAHLVELKRLKSLHLGGTSLTDAGLVRLKELKHLRSLELRSASVTDAGTVHLKELKHLRHLSLTRTSVTHAGINELKQALPQTTIVH